MPKSNKPRKPYKQKNRAQYSLFLNFENKEGMKRAFERVEFIAEETLVYGTCDSDDVGAIRDFLNLGTTLIAIGHHVPKDFEEKYAEVYGYCIDLFESYYLRTLHKKIFTATADEINGIRLAVILAASVIQDEFEKEPAFVLDCFRGTKRITDSVAQRKPHIDKDFLNRAVRQAASSSIRDLCAIARQ